jgi:hypothetical protein
MYDQLMPYLQPMDPLHAALQIPELLSYWDKFYQEHRVPPEFPISNMADYVDIDNSGAPHIDLSHLTRDQAAALSETTVESYMEGSGDNAQMVKRVRIKFHSKTQALEALSRNLGLFAEDNSQGVKSLVEIMAIVMGEKHDAK